MKFPSWLTVYGDIDYRNKRCHTETAEQITFFNELRARYEDIAEIALHIRNEGKRSHEQTRRQKAEGMKTGASDIIIPGSPTFVCELKRLDHTLSKWQPGQLEYLENCQRAGAFVCVALGYRAALQAVEQWLSE